ncbi:MAG: metal ABC transporter permease [Candidatus Omnitrophica bacterium]|nr:metal ABC transporter permease [Candidatus Omnitrophota bacterium]
MEFIQIMYKPLLACLILTGIHAYLGIHVIERQVIFVDLALAQIAALGAAVALIFHFEPESPASYFFSLAAAMVGAVIFSLTRTRKEKIPQEAIIGIVYAVSAALAILVLSRSPEGDEHLRQMLVGNILLVNSSEILKMLFLYGAIGVIHFWFRKIFIEISSHPEETRIQGRSIQFWDMIFYLTFGVVVTSSVKIAGVLLVFSYLIVPAVAGSLYGKTIRSRLVIGWLVGGLGSLLGITLSYFLDLPTGATIVCSFGGILLALALLKPFLIHS